MKKRLLGFAGYSLVTVCGFSQSTNCVAPSAGMVLWLSFDELSGTTSANLASPLDPATQVNSPVVVNGYVGHSLGFNGLDQYVTVPDCAAIDIGTGDLGLRMLVGSDDGAKVYLNAKQVYKAPGPHGFVAAQDTVSDIALNPGLNVLVFKVVNEFQTWRGSIRFTDHQDNPVKGIAVTLDPEGKDLR